MKQLTRHCLCLLLAVMVYGTSPAADDQGMPDYDHAVTHLFWDDLYSEGGWSLYCGYHFDSGHKTPQGKNIETGHIYPVAWMLKAVGCDSRLQCFEEHNNDFMEMESDLHNIYPVWQVLITLRGDMPFGEVEGEDWRFSDCDYEWDAGLVEPRSIARGNIARAILYMHDRYGLPLDGSQLATLMDWNRQDPPSSQERYRNERIEQLQGRRNPYIDRPDLAEDLQLSLQRD